jgi:hypothetical protein
VAAAIRYVLLLLSRFGRGIPQVFEEVLEVDSCPAHMSILMPVPGPPNYPFRDVV